MKIDIIWHEGMVTDPPRPDMTRPMQMSGSLTFVSASTHTAAPQALPPFMTALGLVSKEPAKTQDVSPREFVSTSPSKRPKNVAALRDGVRIKFEAIDKFFDIEPLGINSVLRPQMWTAG